MIDAINAVFDGERLKFRISGKDLSIFEASTSLSAYAMMRRFAASDWTIADIEATLSFALASAEGTQEVKTARAIAKFGAAIGHISRLPPVHHARVIRVLTTRPPAVYADLAYRVLAACLVGLEPAEAVFDDGTLPVPEPAPAPVAEPA